MKHEVLYDQDQVVVWKITGQIEYEDREALNNYLQKFFDQGKELVLLEMSAMNYIGSAGIGTLGKFQKKFLQNKRKLYLLNTQDDIRKILDSIGLGSRLDFVNGSYEDILKGVNK